MQQKAGRIIAAGMTKEVIFEAVEGSINARVDDAYRAKYACSPYMETALRRETLEATFKIISEEELV